MFGIRVRCLPIVAGVLLSLLTPPTLAAPVNYGDFSGSNVQYKQVIESSSPGDADMLVGAPHTSADILDFDPLAYTAQSQAGGADFTSSAITMNIESLASRSIAAIQISDSGDASLIGFGGTNSTLARVNASVSVGVYAIDGVNINPFFAPSSLTYTPNSGQYRFVTEGGGSSFFTTPWTGTVTIDVNSLLTAQGLPFINGATKVSLTIDAGLVASSEATTNAQIARKDFAIATTARRFGDYNGGGMVDAADYVVWRNGLGTTFTNPQYDNWRGHFGEALNSAAATGLIGNAGPTVPEPTTWVILAPLIVAIGSRFRAKSGPCGIALCPSGAR